MRGIADRSVTYDQRRAAALSSTLSSAFTFRLRHPLLTTAAGAPPTTRNILCLTRVRNHRARDETRNQWLHAIIT
jgi:hypothetical protein